MKTKHHDQPCGIEVLEARIAPATLMVANLLDSGPGSLRSAIETANSNGQASNTIQITVNGTIALKSALPDITTSMTIGPALNTGHVTIDGDKQFQIFSVEASQANIYLQYLTLTHGVTGGTSTSGGAVQVNDSGGYVEIDHCNVIANTAVGGLGGGTASGGGIGITAGSVALYSCKVSGNIAETVSAAGGAHAYGGGIDNHGTLSIHDSLITKNKALGGPGEAGEYGFSGFGGSAAAGGGISSFGSLTIEGSIISKNEALGGNGGTGFSLGKGGTQDNGQNGESGGAAGNVGGGGIFISGSSLNLSTSTVSGNLARGGHGGHGGNGGAGGDGTPGMRGAAGGSGGQGGSSGSVYGGGITTAGGGSASVSSSTISGNAARHGVAGAGGAKGAGGAGGAGAGRGAAGNAGGKGVTYFSHGGGVYGGSLTFSQVTIGGNTADIGGGGYINQNANSSFDNCTIAFNRSTKAGGASGLEAEVGAGNYTMNSSIIAENSGPAGTFNLGGITDVEFCLIQSYNTAEMLGGFENITGVSARLGALGAHGGPTDTYLPSHRSMALSNGSNPDNLSVDQRGDPRTINGFIDIGSVQVSQ